MHVYIAFSDREVFLTEQTSNAAATAAPAAR